MKPLRVAIIGYGKIAENEHLPAIDANPRLELAATVGSRSPGRDGVPAFSRHGEMLGVLRDLELDAVAITTPPGARYDIARDFLETGLHVLLEKPPGVTLSEVEDLACRAAGRQVTLFTTWHSQYNRAVDAAAQALAGKRIASMRITWHEDVRKFHPGQQWIWEVGGFGVFDPGINGLSILTKILPDPIFVKSATLSFPANADAPIAADLVFSTGHEGEELRANFDWREEGPQIWDIVVETEAGQTLHLAEGGSRLSVDGREIVAQPPAEYEGLYARFGELIDSGTSEVDAAPFRLVADAFMIGRRVQVEPFTE